MQLFNSLVCWTKHPVKKTKDLWCKCMLLTILYICCELFRALIRDQFEHYLEETKTVKSKIKFLNKCSLCLLSTKKLFSFCTLLVVDWFCVIFVYFLIFWLLLLLLLLELFIFIFHTRVHVPDEDTGVLIFETIKEDILFGRLMRGKSRRLRVFLTLNMFLLTLRARPNSFHE